MIGPDTSQAPPSQLDKRTRYAQIVASLLSRRRSLTKPLKLDAEGRLATQYSVARDTLRRAMSVLEKQGAVTRARGRGTYLLPERTSRRSMRGAAIGLVLPWWSNSARDHHVATVLDATTEWAGEGGCRFDVLRVPRLVMDERALLAKAMDRDLAGLIWVHPVPEQLTCLSGVARHLPCVVIGRPYPDRRFHTVMPDYREAARLLDGHLAQAGHGQYAVLSKSPADPYGAQWLSAFDAASAARGAYFDHHANFVNITQFERERLTELLLEFYLPHHPDVTALVATSSSYLVPLMADQRFRSLVPRDLSLAVFDYGIQAMDTYWPGHTITHVRCDWGAIGRRAGDLLLEVLEHDHTPRIIREPVALVEGQTVRDRGDAAAAATTADSSRKEVPDRA